MMNDKISNSLFAMYLVAMNKITLTDKQVKEFAKQGNYKYKVLLRNYKLGIEFKKMVLHNSLGLTTETYLHMISNNKYQKLIKTHEI
jgi:hypothetical protein